MSGIGLEDLKSGTPWWGGKGIGVGDTVEGIIVSASKEQQTDFDTGQGLVWDNGDPRMESVIIFDSDLRNSEIENDDGKRALHLRGGKYEAAEGSGTSGEDALREAMQKAGLRAEAGVKIKAAITGMAKPTGRGRNAAKLWTIRLEKAELPEGLGEEDIFG